MSGDKIIYETISFDLSTSHSLWSFIYVCLTLAARSMRLLSFQKRIEHLTEMLSDILISYYHYYEIIEKENIDNVYWVVANFILFWVGCYT